MLALKMYSNKVIALKNFHLKKQPYDKLLLPSQTSSTNVAYCLLLKEGFTEALL